MQQAIVPSHEYPLTGTTDDAVEQNASGVSWAAVFAGATAAAALSLILIILGTGLGFAALSPWSEEGLSATTLGVSAIVWLALTQIIASGMGGYLAGRLRVKWTAVHGDEVYFRDTAHGFLSWALATLVTAAFLGSALTGMAAGGANMAAKAATPALTAVAAGATSSASNAQGQSGDGPLGYFVDSLFRTDQPATLGNEQQATRQAGAIIGNAIRTGSLSDDDKAYLAQLVASRTGMEPAQAQQRVDEVYTRVSDSLNEMEETAKNAADEARKATSLTALWMFVALLCGAFVASLTGTYGGRQRDAVRLN